MFQWTPSLALSKGKKNYICLLKMYSSKSNFLFVYSALNILNLSLEFLTNKFYSNLYTLHQEIYVFKIYLKIHIKALGLIIVKIVFDDFLQGTVSRILKVIDEYEE